MNTIRIMCLLGMAIISGYVGLHVLKQLLEMIWTNTKKEENIT